MNRIAVESSNLAEVGYDPDTNILEVAFKHGGVYRYFNVPSGVYTALMAAPSKGRYFDIHIKKAGYSFEKISR